MKKLIMILIITILLFFVISCESVSKGCKHNESSLIGLNRIVKLYDCNGKVIKQYEGRFMIETVNGVLSFILDGKEIKLSGIYTSEEQ